MIEGEKIETFKEQHLVRRKDDFNLVPVILVLQFDVMALENQNPGEVLQMILSSSPFAFSVSLLKPFDL